MNARVRSTNELANSALKRSDFWQPEKHLPSFHMITGWELNSQPGLTEVLSDGGTPLACAAIAVEALPHNFRSKWKITLFPLAFSRGSIMGTCNADAFKLSQQTSLCRLIPCCVPNSWCETRSKQLLREGTVSDKGCQTKPCREAACQEQHKVCVHLLQVWQPQWAMKHYNACCFITSCQGSEVPVVLLF